MNRFIFIIVMIAITIQTANAQTGPFGGGDGITEATAFEIYTKAHLEELADSVNNNPTNSLGSWSKGKYFQLMNDITDTIRTIIGNAPYTHLFEGHFNGNNFKIVLGIDTAAISFNMYTVIGLFGVIRNGTIINLRTEGYVKYSSYNSVATVWIGGIAGTVSDNNYDKPTIFKNCINSCDVYFEGQCFRLLGPGGITGSAHNCIIENCINTGNMYSTSNSDTWGAGGIIGGVGYGITIKKCINIGFVGNESFAGGIAGACNNFDTLKIDDCINIGFVKGKYRVGGILGNTRQQPAIVTNCINAGFIEGNESIGGIVGYALNNNTVITNCINTGIIEGEESVGGITGDE
ncbi:MAG: hypothetical protein FWG85_01215 [Bacteroidetes bacterium]|nr:hypothetical protein [Bacteroidota bacterium]